MDLFGSTFWRRAIVAVGAAIVGLPGLGAHELEAAVTLAAPSVLIRATYGGTDPVVYAKVQVFAPDSREREFQTAVTDRRGWFSFVPDGPGDWRVIVDDEEGHRREVQVSVPRLFESNAAAVTAPASRFERVVLGLALMVGGTGFLYGFKARRSSGRLPS